MKRVREARDWICKLCGYSVEETRLPFAWHSCLPWIGPAMLNGARLLFATMLFAWLSFGAKSHEWPVKRNAPDYDNASCIGDMSTPVCATESLLACLSHEYPNLCVQLGLPAPDLTGPSGPPMYREYKIVAVQPADAQLAAERLGENIHDWLGVYEVRFLERRCLEGKSCDNKNFERMIHYLKRKDEIWVLFRWAIEDSGLTCEELPEKNLWKAMCARYIDSWVMPWVHREEEFD